MRVTNLTSPRSGHPVANQYEIIDDKTGVATFQSYQTVIAKKLGWRYFISNDWNYSRTTSKYFTQWLRSYGWNNTEIADLKKWLRRANTGDEIRNISPNNVSAKLVNEI